MVDNLLREMKETQNYIDEQKALKSIELPKEDNIKNMK